MPSENNINNFKLISFQRSSITRNGITKSTPLILNGDMAKRSKKNPVNEIVYRIFFVAPRVGLEPTTARLTAACSTDWAIEDYNKNTVPSLDYVSGTFFSTFKTAYSIFHPQSWTCSWYSSVVYASSRGHYLPTQMPYAFVPTLRCYCLFAVIHMLAALTYSCYPAQMQSCSQSASWK